MSYTEKTISIFGTEIEFLQAFINAITAADSRITCATDIEAQFADPSNTPSFTLSVSDSVNEIYTITFTRYGALSSTGYKYMVSSSTYSGNIDFFIQRRFILL